MKRTNVILMSAVIVLSLAACKKKKITPEEEASKKDLLVNKDWVLTALKLSMGGQESDEFGSLSACHKDDIYRFEDSGVYTLSEGATKCNPEDTDKGKWTLNSDQNVLTVMTSDTTKFDVIEITETSLKVSSTESLNGIPVKETSTFSKK